MMSSEEGHVTGDSLAGRGFRSDFKNLADSCWRSLGEAAGVTERIPMPEDIARDFSKGYMVDARIQYVGERRQPLLPVPVASPEDVAEHSATSS